MNEPIVYCPSEGSGAWLSGDQLYRYSLWRCWDPTLPPLVWIMCNPSTADDVENDQTIKKCVGFARALGYGGIVVVNLWSFRSRDAKAMRSVRDAVGDRNADAIRAALVLATSHQARTAIAAWGKVARANGPHYEDRVHALVELASEVGASLQALQVSADGTPTHPLTLPYSLRPEPWAWRGSWICRDCTRRTR